MKNDIEFLTYAIRDHYARKKQETHPRGRYVIPKNVDLDVHWKKAAKNCQELSLDPEGFIDLAFRVTRRDGGPFPNMLGSSGMLANCKKALIYRPDRDQSLPEEATGNLLIDEAVERLKWEVYCVLTGMMNRTGSDLPEDNMFSLQNIFFDIPSYWRIYMAPDDPIVRKRFYDKAEKELQSSPKLQKAFEILKIDMFQHFPNLSQP